MKKVLVSAVILLVVFLGGSFFLFPGKEHAGGSLTSSFTLALALRQLPDTSQWKNWWPWSNGPKGGGQPEGQIQLAGSSESQVLLNWKEGNTTIPVTVSLSTKGNDSTLLFWSAEWGAGNSPFARIREFGRRQRLGNDMKTLLAAFGMYTSKPENSYGFKPVYTMVTDTVLISTKSVFAAEPGTEEIYAMVNKLENYAKSRGAAITGFPMYHIIPSVNSFEVMVALPISKIIENSGSYIIKRMVDGHLLVGEVKAGPIKLKKLFEQFEQYKNDYQLASPAIPYLQPLTNRLQNPDTSQWVTRMCYPIF